MKNIHTVSIVGMGALGLLYGARIAEARGIDTVTYIMDEERLKRSQGAEYTVNGKSFPFRRSTPEQTAPADLLIVAVKYTGLLSAFPVMAPCIDDHTIILSVLNGISSEDMIAERFRRDHMIYTVPQGMDAMKFGNSLRYTQTGALHLGILSEEIRPDLDAVLRFFDETGMPYVCETDIMRRMWFKYMLNVGVNQVCMVYNTTYAGVLRPGEPHEMLWSAMDEVRQIADAKGIGLTEADMQTCLDIEATLDPEGMPSMAQDRINKKKSEVEMFAGTVIRLGRELGIPTPTNEKIQGMVRDIEAGYAR